MFVLIPLLGIPLFFNSFFRARIEQPFKCFITGILLASVVLLTRGIYNAIAGYEESVNVNDYLMQNGSRILSEGFSIFQHPTYFSLEINFALILLLYFFRDWKIRLPLLIIFILVLSAAIFFAASKMGIIVWVLIIAGVILYSGRKRNIRPVLFISAILILVFFTFLVGRRIERVSFFVRVARLELSEKQINLKNIDQRTREWYTASRVILEKPLTGFGIAKIEDKMREAFMKYGFKEEAQQNLNAHNQFLEAQMTFGIFGSVSVLLMLLVPFLYRKRSPFPGIVAFFISIMIMYLSIESMLNRQWGILFFLLFYFMLISLSDENTSVKRSMV
jgi:O-antigen ligase